ncbi:MAG: hypothetical protein HUU43_17485, partial [Ignavibacteriaceae bacterium]|nr:hypothetical protein [Ignavibacteriaceae bacterium]
MKKIFLLFSALLIAGLSELITAQTNAPDPSIMQQYWFVMLKRGENRSLDSLTAVKLQEGHMANINKMAEMGKLKLAGPFADKGDWRGIFIMVTDSQQEAEELVNQDPAIQAGRLAYEIHPWYGGGDLKTNFDYPEDNEEKDGVKPKMMKSYFFVMLNEGPNRKQDSATAMKIQEEHLGNIMKMVKEGQVRLVGPFLDDSVWKGFFIFDVATEDEVKKLLANDPAIT